MTIQFDQLFIHVFTKDGWLALDSKPGSKIEISLQGQPFVEVPTAFSSATYTLPSTPRPFPFSLRITPKNNQYWPIEGSFEYVKPGELRHIDADLANFAPGNGVQISGCGIVSISIFISRLKEVTSAVLAGLSNVPPSRTNRIPAPWPPTAWDTPLLANINYIAPTPIVNNDLMFNNLSLDPNTTDIVFEVAGVKAPKLLAVNWPNSIARTASSDKTPFLVYFHPHVTQNVRDGYYSPFPYPYGWDYLYYGLYRYIYYLGDPLTINPYCKGIPYQICASGKNVVSVLPLNKVPEEVGVMLDAAATLELLQEIDGFMFRRAGIYRKRPQIGRSALASFSAGNAFVSQLISGNKNRSHVFCQEILQEIYIFEAPDPILNFLIPNMKYWISSGSTSATKIMRIYKKNQHPMFAGVVNKSLPAPPYIVDSSDNRRTVAYLDIGSWARATQARGSTIANTPGHVFQDVHQLISAIMLTNALHKSSF